MQNANARLAKLQAAEKEAAAEKARRRTYLAKAKAMGIEDVKAHLSHLGQDNPMGECWRGGAQFSRTPT